MKSELLNCDCMEYMGGLEDGCFDLCVTSPPYNMNLRVNSKGDGYCSRQIVKELSTKYSNYADNLPMVDYERFLYEFIKEACRVSKALVLNIQMVTGNKPALIGAIGRHSDKIKEVVIWDKGSGQPSIAERTLNSAFEFIYIFGDNPIARQFTQADFKGTKSNIWRVQPRPGADKTHGAGFPLEIPERAFELFKPESVFDPFLGTGTTAIAAHYYGCDFVGCEIDADYLNTARERIKYATAQQAMF